MSKGGLCAVVGRANHCRHDFIGILTPRGDRGDDCVLTTELGSIASLTPKPHSPLMEKKEQRPLMEP